MLAVLLVQKIIDPNVHFKVLIHSVSGIGGNHSKTGAAVKIFTEDVVPATSPRSQPVAAVAPESLNISCEVTFRHGSLRLNGAISENILNLLIRELKR